jgi:hypothetical protein
MKQHYCFDCGIPVIDRLCRDPGNLAAFLCLMCSVICKDTLDNGVSIKTPHLCEKPHMPRWNYPKEKIYRAKDPVPAASEWNYLNWLKIPNINTFPTGPLQVNPQTYYTQIGTTSVPQPYYTPIGVPQRYYYNNNTAWISDPYINLDIRTYAN